ncbi:MULTISPECIES: D-alanyl-D-alanine carboxypeptidase family protein [Thermomonosporaceae]|uniref:D-alanyl-D-alanine carboxypeptidase family protein n=1 Tax=Thermomonosporaceae TaxID=2012 RepID=UPI00255A7808|nr:MULTISPECIES: D-alanyl-D-alanine carboxypeptidase family protein [Thermomonosporaceae]MDL4772477.1 D-alanyl-D-alanine carboxypeptidase family protein [Actinomadura xylanilytica]
MPNPRRSAVLTAVFLVMATLVPFTPGRAAEREGDTLEALRREASKARTDLEKATKEMEDRKKALATAQTKLRGTLRDLATAEAELNRIRLPLARLANTSYQQPGAAGSMAIFGGGSPDAALRSTADVTLLARSQQALVDHADELQKRKQSLVSAAQDLQSRNAIDQTRVQQQIDGLKQKSSTLTKQLTAMLSRLPLDQRLAASCDKSLATKSRQFPNGLIPAKYLCPLPQKGAQLRADAALAFYKLNAGYKRRFGQQICVTDSYRSLPDQHRVYAERPGFAAVPGTSNHGKGQAVDLCGGVQSSGSSQFNWMESHAKVYGWIHPAWAYSNPFEPWHWEYGTDGDR